ncbi:hypothetical protein GCM10011490_28660 [Pseudoclavibacter endophyticus]|uniref:single-stranded DNA-binding protein n=1 Tax=Pseudoclavibacter endophyticus TaxID=1778590 RepID=UPI001665A1D7|nr:single-stranded DNA-binding protein [Pseudoclavibacter endophyticus]GGA76131.1 hypothetical protein GCM10011490_28660 [Pseudoclavibacter endophyticus]
MQNHITLIGRVGGQPDTRTTPWGDLEATFRLATTERWRKKSGEWEDGPTSWFTVRALRGMAESVRDSVDKGQQLIVTGRVRVRPWENDRGSGVAVEIDADHIGPDLLVATAAVTRRPPSNPPAQPGHPDNADRHASTGASTPGPTPGSAPLGATEPQTAAIGAATVPSGDWGAPGAGASRTAEEPPF